MSREYVEDLHPRWEHLSAVGELADVLAVWTGRVPAHVVAAAWLHDIGYAPDLVCTGFHPLDGAWFLQSLGYPPEVVSLVGWHSAAEREAHYLGLSRDLLRLGRPEQADLDLVTMFDLVTGPHGDLTRVEDRIQEVLQRHGPGTVVFEGMSRSRQYLFGCAGRSRARLGLSYDWPTGIAAAPVPQWPTRLRAIPEPRIVPGSGPHRVPRPEVPSRAAPERTPSEPWAAIA